MIFMWNVSISSQFFQSDSTLFLLNIIKIIKEWSCDQLCVRKCRGGEWKKWRYTTTSLVIKVGQSPCLFKLTQDLVLTSCYSRIYLQNYIVQIMYNCIPVSDLLTPKGVTISDPYVFLWVTSVQMVFTPRVMTPYPLKDDFRHWHPLPDTLRGPCLTSWTKSVIISDLYVSIWVTSIQMVFTPWVMTPHPVEDNFRF